VSSRIPKPLRAAARWAIGLALLAVLLARFDLAAVAGALSGVDLWVAIPALSGLVAVHLVAGATWWLLTCQLTGERMPWGRTLRTYYIAQGIGGLTPGNVGSDAYRLLAPETEGGWRRRLGPIAVQRITSSLALAGLGCLALSWLPLRGLAPLVVGSALVLAIGTSAVMLLISRRAPWWRSSDAPAGPGRASGLSRGTLCGLVGGAAFHVASLIFGLLIVAAITPVPSPLQVLACLAVARLAILVPISPSGLGIQEAGLSFLFVAIGMDPAVALAAALLSRAALVATTLLGVVLLAAPGLPPPIRRPSRPPQHHQGGQTAG